MIEKELIVLTAFIYQKGCSLAFYTLVYASLSYPSMTISQLFLPSREGFQALMLLFPCRSHFGERNPWHDSSTGKGFAAVAENEQNRRLDSFFFFCSYYLE